MSIQVLLAHDGDDQRCALQSFLKRLLQHGIVDGVYTPMRVAQGDGVAPALVRNADMLDDADPLAPLMLINGARAVADLTVGGAPQPLAAVLRSCEIRALIELAKLKQASLERLTLIGVDCTGTYEVGDYARLVGAHGDAAAVGVCVRPACHMCEYPAPANTQITIMHIGVDGLMVEMDEEMAGKMGIAPHPDPLPVGERELPSPPRGEGRGEGESISWQSVPAADLARRQDALAHIVAQHATERDAVMAAFGKKMTSPDALAGYFAACQRCLNCMTACPICYCKECLFRSHAFAHEPGSYLRLAERKGATRLPADTVLFHLTRLNHMSTSCVGCGLCESACPSNIPLSVLFRTVGAHTQALFGYVPGRSLDDEIPLMTFREAELEDVR